MILHYHGYNHTMKIPGSAAGWSNTS